MSLRLVVAMTVGLINAGFATHLFLQGASWAFNGIAAVSCGAIAIFEYRRCRS